MGIDEIKPKQTLWQFSMIRYPELPELRQVEVMYVPPKQVVSDIKECVVTTTGEIVPVTDLYPTPEEVASVIQMHLESFARLRSYYEKSLAVMGDQLTAVTFPA